MIQRKQILIKWVYQEMYIIIVQEIMTRKLFNRHGKKGKTLEGITEKYVGDSNTATAY